MFVFIAARSSPTVLRLFLECYDRLQNATTLLSLGRHALLYGGSFGSKAARSSPSHQVRIQSNAAVFALPSGAMSRTGHGGEVGKAARWWWRNTAAPESAGRDEIAFKAARPSGPAAWGPRIMDPNNRVGRCNDTCYQIYQLVNALVPT